MIKFSELLDQLGIRRGQLQQWIAEGLPWQPKGRSKQFDEGDVAQWLIDNGKASAESDDGAERVLNTRAEAARYFGVSDRTISVWQDKPGFPGNAGTAGKRDGYYPVNQITAWRAAQESAGDGSTDELGNEIKRERLRKLRLSNDETAGGLVDLEEVRRFIIHTHALARRELYNLPAEVLQVLPPDLDDVVIEETRRKITARLDNATDILAQLIKAYDGGEAFGDESVAAS